MCLFKSLYIQWCYLLKIQQHNVIISKNNNYAPQSLPWHTLKGQNYSQSNTCMLYSFFIIIYAKSILNFKTSLLEHLNPP